MDFEEWWEKNKGSTEYHTMIPSDWAKLMVKEAWLAGFGEGDSAGYRAAQQDEEDRRNG